MKRGRLIIHREDVENIRRKRHFGPSLQRLPGGAGKAWLYRENVPMTGLVSVVDMAGIER